MRKEELINQLKDEYYLVLEPKLLSSSNNAKIYSIECYVRDGDSLYPSARLICTVNEGTDKEEAYWIKTSQYGSPEVSIAMDRMLKEQDIVTVTPMSYLSDNKALVRVVKKQGDTTITDSEIVYLEKGNLKRERVNL